MGSTVEGIVRDNSERWLRGAGELPKALQAMVRLSDFILRWRVLNRRKRNAVIFLQPI